MFYRIINCDEPALFWSARDGWVRYDYDLYDELQRGEMRLPLAGMWEKVSTADVDIPEHL